jgi:CHAT domain-containing protein
VLATLWEVDDAATATILREFHRRFAAGEGAATALRGAQLARLNDENPALRGSVLWAPFVMIGAL